jgi:hypothetical protein
MTAVAPLIGGVILAVGVNILGAHRTAPTQLRRGLAYLRRNMQHSYPAARLGKSRRQARESRIASLYSWCDLETREHGRVVG